MAVIGSIRKRGGLLVVLVAGALALFVLQGLWSGGGPSGNENRETVAKVDGEPVTLQEYQSEYRDLQFSYYVQNKKRVESDQEIEFKSNATEIAITNKLWQKEMEILGITLTMDGASSEFQDMFDPNGITLPKTLITTFVDSTGTFSPDIYSQNKAFMEAPIGENDGQQQVESKNQWAAFKNSAIKNRARSKYLDLLVKSTYIPTCMAKRTYLEESNTAVYNMLYIPYQSIADSTFTDDELNLGECLNKNKPLFIAQNDAVNVDLFAFKIVPSSQDTIDLRSKVDTVFEVWQSTSENDTVFLQNNADGINAIPQYLSYNQLPPKVKADSSFNAEINGVEYGKVAKFYAPEFNPREGAYHSYKVSEIKLDTIFEMEVTQLFYSKAPNLDTLIDNALNTLKDGGDIMSEAIKNTQLIAQEPSVKKEYDKYVGFDGKLKNFTSESDMFANDLDLRDKLFAIKDTGLVEEVVETDNFRYIIYVHKTKSIKETLNRFLVSDLDNSLVPSDFTRNSLYEQAITFQGQCGRSKDGFYKKLKEDSLIDQKLSINLDFGPRPVVFDQKTYRQRSTYATVLKSPTDRGEGIKDNNREVLEWAWVNDVDTEPEFFQLQNAYVVAVINSKEVKGEVKPNAIENPMLKREALKDKKQEVIIDNLSNMLKGDLVDIAGKYNEKYKLTVDGQMAVKSWNEKPIPLSTNDPYNNEKKGRFNEPAVIGKVFGLPVDTRSEPFRGEQGIFIVEVLEKEEGKPSPDGDYSFVQKDYLDKIIGNDPKSGQVGSNVESAINNALRFNAEIEDFRYFHF